MAAAGREPQLVTITVNGADLRVPAGELIVEAVKRLDLDIPIFCYHRRMKPVGMCRMCLVEVGFRQPDGSVKMMPKPQTGCTLGASDGMVIFTDTESVQRDRRGVLELLLINHPLDCPICDRGGECPLQNNTMFYGPSTSRFVEEKRHLPKAFPLSKHVTLDLERCIQCGRCVRFTEEISGDYQLAFLFRGSQMQPQTFELTDFDSKFSGNVIEICPVGALTSTEYRFRARPWDLETKPAVCLECSNGCATWFDYRVGKLVRINGRTNEAVNEEWTCDKGKFGQDYLNSSSRLTEPLIRSGDALVACTWADAYTTILEFIGGKPAAGLCSGMLSNEDLFLWKKMMCQQFGSKSIDHRWYRNLPQKDESIPALHGIAEVNTPIAAYEDEPVIFVMGDLVEQQPILYLRIRKARYRKGARVIVACDHRTEMDSFAEVILRYRTGTEAALIGGLLNCVSGSAGVSPKQAEEVSGVSQDVIKRAAASLKDGFVVVSSRSLYNLMDGKSVVSALANLCVAAGSADKFNLYSLQANEQGALDLGILPADDGMNTYEVLRACAEGKLDVLWLLQCDPFRLSYDRDLVKSALERVPFLIVQDILETEATHYASVVLPCCAYSEMDGTYVNMERRVQRIMRIVPPKGSAKPSWKIFSEVMLRLTGRTPPFSAREVAEMISREVPAFQGIGYGDLAGEGRLLSPVTTGNSRIVDTDYSSSAILEAQPRND